jgi:hypothetical protein
MHASKKTENSFSSGKTRSKAQGLSLPQLISAEAISARDMQLSVHRRATPPCLEATAVELGKRAGNLVAKSG